MKYLIAEVYCDRQEEEAPNFVILPLDKDTVHALAVLRGFVNGAKGISRTLAAVEFDWHKCYWMCGESGLEGTDVAVIHADDVMAIVGEDMNMERVRIDADGDISFIAVTSDKLHVRSTLVNIERLVEAVKA